MQRAHFRDGVADAIIHGPLADLTPMQVSDGDTLQHGNVKRPGTGLNPMRWEEIVGTIAIRDYNEDELIEL